MTRSAAIIFAGIIAFTAPALAHQPSVPSDDSGRGAKAERAHQMNVQMPVNAQIPNPDPRLQGYTANITYDDLRSGK